MPKFVSKKVPKAQVTPPEENPMEAHLPKETKKRAQSRKMKEILKRVFLLLFGLGLCT